MLTACFNTQNNRA